MLKSINHISNQKVSGSQADTASNFLLLRKTVYEFINQNFTPTTIYKLVEWVAEFMNCMMS